MNFSKLLQIPALVSAPHQTVSSGKILHPKQMLAFESVWGAESPIKNALMFTAPLSFNNCSYSTYTMMLGEQPHHPHRQRHLSAHPLLVMEQSHHPVDALPGPLPHILFRSKSWQMLYFFYLQKIVFFPFISFNNMEWYLVD